MPPAEPSTAVDHQPRAGCWLLVIPVILTVVIVLAYLFIGTLGVIGRPADGARVEIRYQTCAEALPLIRDRAEAMGLGDLQTAPEPGGMQLVATMPADEGVASRIPETLALGGDFAIVDAHTGERITRTEQVESAVPHLRITGSPITRVSLNLEGRRALGLFVRDHPDGRIAVEVDGQRLAEIPTSDTPGGDNIEVPTGVEDPTAALEVAAGRAIAVQHGPLPCAARVLAVQPAPAAP